jgi:hypothetical protein
MNQPRFPWPAGTATGVGSLPGTDVREAVRIVLDQLPEFPHLPELPDRGVGADLVGRGAALLVELPVDLQPAGWRLVDRPGRDLRRARALLGEDLDALEELAAGWTGPLKIQAAGPWTLAATIERPRGGRAVADEGATRDIVASLAEGLAAHRDEVARRVPGAQVVVQLDEPSLPAVLRGGIGTASGWGHLPAVAPAVVEAGLRRVLDAVGGGIVHSCAPDVPIGLLRRAGATGVSLDAGLLTEADDEALGEAAEAGTALLLGVVPAVDAELSDVGATVAPVRRLWRRLGLAPERLGEIVVVTPACGLAGASPAHARAALTRAREAARAITDDPEG